MHISSIVPVAVAALVLASCSLFDDEPTPTASTTSTRATTSTTAAPIASSTPPEILDLGEEPRQELRVTYTEGDSATLRFTSDLEITQQSEGRAQRLDSPPITQTLTYTVGETTDAGSAITIRIDALSVEGTGTGLTTDEVTELEATLEPMVGFEATGTVTPLGEFTDVAFETTDGLPDSLSAQLTSLESELAALGPSLPVEAVGIGASWRTTASRSVGGAEVETTSTVTVTAIDDRTLGYTTSMTTAAEAQSIDLEGLDDGTTAELLSSDLAGSSTGSMGLDAVALTLRTRLAGRQEVVLTSSAGTTALTQQVGLAYVAGPASN